ncbi:MAG: hypothetical protein EOO02_01150 [Chitinophagaceae bacterium]|nr:MAG: hypothetical protein EOO02_01150 [Chitinophagaceae bacterium]
MIEVFKTNVHDRFIADVILTRLNESLPGCIMNFDLSDCDRILRICSADELNHEAVKDILTGYGYTIEILEDIPAAYIRPLAVS